MVECPICLDSIGSHDLLGRVHRCLHKYHNQCIIQWSSHSNSCPTCRKLYYGVDIVANDNQNIVMETIEVKDKLIENDAINEIPSEFIIPPLTYGDTYTATRSEEQEHELNSGVCTICSSAQYSRLTRLLFSCISCGAKFHSLCLGHTDEPFWFCPVCDFRQEIITSSRQSRPRRPVTAARRGLVIFNENNEIEDFDDADELVRSTSVLNGGILLRREARAIQNLSPEEARSWELLEQARNGTSASELPVPAPVSETRKRRRRRAVNSQESLQTSVLAESHATMPLETSSLNASLPVTISNNLHNESAVSPDQGRSRIASLISQIKRRPHKSTTHPMSTGNITHSPLSSESLNVADSDSGSELDSKRPCSYVAELTLDQKRRVQKHVRNHLRPLYNPRLESPEPGHIRSEAEYIDVNKFISRKVYASILSLCAREGTKALEYYFADDESKLKLLVDGHVEGWNLEK